MFVRNITNAKILTNNIHIILTEKCPLERVILQPQPLHNLLLTTSPFLSISLLIGPTVPVDPVVPLEER